MCALLSRTKAWTVLDQVNPSMELEDVALVGPALKSIGADPEFIDATWQGKLVNGYIRICEEKVANIRLPLQHMLQESLDGVFAMSEEAVSKTCLLYTSPSPRDGLLSRMPSSA